MLKFKKVLVGIILYFILVPIVFYLGMVLVTTVHIVGWLWGIAFILISLLSLVIPFPNRDEFKMVIMNERKDITFSEIIISTLYFSILFLTGPFAYGVLIYHYHASQRTALFALGIIVILCIVIEIITFYYFFIYPRKPPNSSQIPANGNLL